MPLDFPVSALLASHNLAVRIVSLLCRLHLAQVKNAGDTHDCLINADDPLQHRLNACFDILLEGALIIPSASRSDSPDPSSPPTTRTLIAIAVHDGHIPCLQTFDAAGHEMDDALDLRPVKD